MPNELTIDNTELTVDMDDGWEEETIVPLSVESKVFQPDQYPGVWFGYKKSFPDYTRGMVYIFPDEDLIRSVRASWHQTSRDWIVSETKIFARIDQSILNAALEWAGGLS